MTAAKTPQSEDEELEARIAALLAEREKTSSDNPLVHILWLADGLDLWHRSGGKRGHSIDDTSRYIASNLVRLVWRDRTRPKGSELATFKTPEIEGIKPAPAPSSGEGEQPKPTANYTLHDEDLKTERWLPYIIPPFEGEYEVSSAGRVRRTGSIGFKKPSFNRKGYILVGLSTPKAKKTIPVHRLVAKTFIPEVEGKPAVNHKDGDKANNAVSNLEWVNSSENMAHFYRVLGGKTSNQKLTAEEVIEIRQRLAAGEVVRTIAKDYIVGEQTIFKIKEGKSWFYPSKFVAAQQRKGEGQ